MPVKILNNLKFLLINTPSPLQLGPIARAPPVQVYCPAVMRIQGANPITPLQFDNLRCKSYCPFPDAREACRCESIAPFDFDPSPVRVLLPGPYVGAAKP